MSKTDLVNESLMFQKLFINHILVSSLIQHLEQFFSCMNDSKH